MSRPAGVRNHDFEQKRTELVRKLTDHALESDLRRPALRQFAQAVGASEPTLRHYFGDRNGVVVAVLEEIGRRAQPVWNAVSMGATDIPTAMEEYFRLSTAGMRHGGFVRAHAFGIVEGCADLELAKAYQTIVLRPALLSLTVKLSRTKGGDGDPNERLAAALMMFAPLLAIGLHQDMLGGREIEPMDREAIYLLLERYLVQGILAPVPGSGNESQ